MLTRADKDVLIKMSDGVNLCADIYRPNCSGRYPVVVTRTPYFKETERFVERARYFAECGYVYIIQDVRGRGRSQGNFYPFFSEALDGYDTLTWCAGQSWSNGLIGTIGASYGAWTQWLTAVLHHPNLVTMISEASPPDFFQCLPYQNGAFSLPMLAWLKELSAPPDQEDVIDWDTILNARPLNRLDTLCGHPMQAWQDWLTHDREDSYWEALAFNRHLSQVKVPVFHVSGWYDDVLIGTLINYRGMSQANASSGNGCFQKLLIGPWPHRVNTTSKFGSIDFGEQGIIDLFAKQREWFDHWLKDSGNVLNESPVQLYVLNKNEWSQASQWPPYGTELVNFYLHSDGTANTKNGNGRLDRKVPSSEPSDEFSYDPRTPVQFLTEPGWVQLGGPDDYSVIEEREEVLVYSSEPLEKDLTIAGPLTVELFAASSASDTDFTAKVLDARPDGSALRLNDGIVRARFRNSRSVPTLIVPDRVYHYVINCWASTYVFQRGHRIRLEISSSAFPKFDPNLNTGEAIGNDETFNIAHQKIFHTSEYPSHVVLPVLGYAS